VALVGSIRSDKAVVMEEEFDLCLELKAWTVAMKRKVFPYQATLLAQTGPLGSSNLHAVKRRSLCALSLLHYLGSSHGEFTDFIHDRYIDMFSHHCTLTCLRPSGRTALVILELEIEYCVFMLCINFLQ
jgi:hypothetical protein